MNLSALDTPLPEDFRSMMGVGPSLTPEDLVRYIRQDRGISPQQQAHIINMLNTPDMGGHLLAGASGAAIALAVARWKKMSTSSQVLMSLAGFGLGNIILNKLSGPARYTEWHPETGKSRILL